MTFHSYIGRYTPSERYYLDYTGEIGFKRVCNIITSSKPLPKLETPAIVVNRFKTVRKEIQNGYIETVLNRYDNLEHTTGWFGLDVDNTREKTNLVKGVLFDRLPELKIVWVSSSGVGVKAIGYNSRLLNLPPDKFKSEYKIMCVNLRYRSGMRINFDPAMSRCHQPMFLNPDRGALIRK
jgi:hypothetical protein